MNRLRTAVVPVVAAFFLAACQGSPAAAPPKQSNALQEALRWAGPQKAELQKALHHYNRPQDRLQRRAVAYLISGLPYQTYTEIADTAALARIVGRAASLRDVDARLAYLKDSLGALAARSPAVVKRDLDVIDAAFLIENVDLAFEAWRKPWARMVSFPDFCRYILPYKSPGEKPHRLRRGLLRQYAGLGDTLRARASPLAVCDAVCQQLQQEYHFATAALPLFSTPAAVRCKLGQCFALTQLTGEVMRALGLPVTHEACSWGNYDGGHTWNALYENQRFLPFLFIDATPGSGDFKCELTVAAANDHYRRKRSKVWRARYLPGPAGPRTPAAGDGGDPLSDPLREDVTASVLPCSSVVLPLAAPAAAGGPVYLCTFNHRAWNPVSRGERTNGQVLFRQMGRGLCYLPVQISPQQHPVPVGPPFVLRQDGRLVSLPSDYNHRTTVQLQAKFPINDSNKIKAGDTYQLFFWQDGWQSLGYHKATGPTLQFSQVPTHAVLWLQNMDRGKEERIFTYENGRQVWW